MEILFTGNKPQKKTYSYSVKENNNSNVITFIFDKVQENLDLSSLSCFVKVHGSEIDKDVPTVRVRQNKIHVNWTLQRKHTDTRILNVQLQFEGIGDIVWQSDILQIVLSDTIKADEYIQNKYPAVLTNHEDRIQTLEEGGGGGGGSSNAVSDIKIVEMKILQRKGTEHNKRDYIVSTNEDEELIKNDPRNAFFVLKTSIIDKKAEQEIRNGRFVIRFDYSIPFNKREEVKQKGYGCYSFAHNFYFKEQGAIKEIKSKDFLINSLIFVTPNDIVETEFGDKYILIKMPVVELANKFYTCNGELNALEDNFFDSEEEVIEVFKDRRVGGAFQYNEIKEELEKEGYSIGRLYGSSLEKNFYKSNAFNGLFQNPNKIISLLNYHCPFVVNLTDTDAIDIESKFIRKKSNIVSYSPSDYIVGVRCSKYPYINPNLIKKLFAVSVKPRCAIIDENFETKQEGSIWLKKYSQCEKRISTKINEVVCISEEMPIKLALITRFNITK